MGKKCFIVASETQLSLKTFRDHFKNRIPGLQEVSTVEECDFILAFCSVVDESDITEKVKTLQDISGI